MTWKCARRICRNFAPAAGSNILELSVERALNRHYRFFSFLAVLAVLSAFAWAPVVLGAEVDAASAIASARQQLVVCYQASVDSERVGANITHLTRVLTDAGELLSDAELAFSKGDFDVALDLAVQCREGLLNFASEANALAVSAAEAKNVDFLTNVAGSGVGIVAVVVIGVTVWFLVKKRYGPLGEAELSWRRVD